MMAITQTVAPTLEPVTIEEALSHLRIDGTDEDAYVGSLLIAARRYAENVLQRQIMRATFTLTLDYFPDTILLPYPPLGAVSSITYADSSGTTQTLSASIYQVVNDPHGASIVPSYGNVWPATRTKPEAVTVTYTAGWSTRALVPQTIKQAILLIIGHWFENREAVTTGTTINEFPMAVESLLNMERAWSAH